MFGFVAFSARAAVVLAVVAVAIASCASSASNSTTSTDGAPLTTLSAPRGSDAPPPTSSSTTSPPKRTLGPPEYRIVERIEGVGEGEGDTVIVQLDPATYSSLTDIDLYDIIVDVVELFPPISVVHIVDDPAAANIVGDPDASEADRKAVFDNYLARLENGFEITYLGPFASSGTAVLGS